MKFADFAVCHDALPQNARDQISEFLGEVPFDPFIKHIFTKQFRQKALCRFNLAKREMLEHRPLAQSRENNPVVKGASRLYPPIPPELIQTEEFSKLLDLFWRQAKRIYERTHEPFTGDPIIMVQFQRTSCHKENEVSMAVYEGAHQDGGAGSVLGLVHVDMHHVLGGKPLLYSDKEAENVLFKGEDWSPGSLLTFSDESCWHDAEPITCSRFCKSGAGKTKESGYRDVIILYWDDRNCLMPSPSGN